MVVVVCIITIFFILPVHSFAYDTVLPQHKPNDCACATWTSNSSSKPMWSSQSAWAMSGSACALPGRAVTPDPTLPEYSPSDGWCYCSSSQNGEVTPWYTWCSPPKDYPSQINLLVVNASTVAVNFVTSDKGARAGSGVVAELRKAGDSHGQVTTYSDGFSTLYKDSTQDRFLSYHHIALHSLAERTNFEYRVRVAAHENVEASEWSDWLGFRSLYSTGLTRIAMYADMGVFASQFDKPSIPATSRHCFGNLIDDVSQGLVDFAVHSGDHAYEFEVSEGARGDGYMDAYSQFLAHTPWAPGWGNHEYLELDKGNRLANITAGLIAEKAKMVPTTDRMKYSINIGLVHILQLDLSPYWCRFNGCIGVDTCGFPDRWVKNASSTDPDERYDFLGYRDSILAFVRADLEAVDRSKTPWVVMTGHYPMYETYDNFHPSNLARQQRALDRGARGEGAAGTGSSPVASKQQALNDLEPLLKEFDVDMFFSGHDHNYETTWPVFNYSIVQKSFDNPRAPVHILSGSAGPPEWDNFQPNPPAWSRSPRLQVNSYSRVTAWNASTLQFEQVSNDNGTVVDEFFIRTTRQ